MGGNSMLRKAQGVTNEMLNCPCRSVSPSCHLTIIHLFVIPCENTRLLFSGMGLDRYLELLNNILRPLTKRYKNRLTSGVHSRGPTSIHAVCRCTGKRLVIILHTWGFVTYEKALERYNRSRNAVLSHSTQMIKILPKYRV